MPLRLFSRSCSPSFILLVTFYSISSVIVTSIIFLVVFECELAILNDMKEMFYYSTQSTFFPALPSRSQPTEIRD